jgi:ubiquinone/menaquinone biosynthesis C-methylase UbiE
MSSFMMDRSSLERLPAHIADRILRESEENDAIYKARGESGLDLTNLHYFHARMIHWGIQRLAPSLVGLRVLDIGVGDGQSSVLLARQGAQVTGIEVSSEALDRARRVAARYEAAIDLRAMACECLEFPDETFDAVLCISAYHHMDQKLASREIARVLRPGGRAVFVEPLASNPPAWAYRRLVRWSSRNATSHERPLRLQDLEILRRHFRKVDWQGMFLLTTSMIFLDRIWNDSNPTVHRLTSLGFKWLLPMDDRLLKIAGFGKIAWKICVVVEK